MPYKNYADALRNYVKNAPTANARRRARRDDEVRRKERKYVQKRRLENAKLVIVQKAMSRIPTDKWLLGTAQEAVRLLHWPTYCPALGIELNYLGKRNDPANVSLDRHDNDKPYVHGNVFIISYRANSIKTNATVKELYAVAWYAKNKPKVPAPAPVQWEDSTPELDAEIARVFGLPWPPPAPPPTESRMETGLVEAFDPGSGLPSGHRPCPTIPRPP
jgi:hypothetical protein